MLTVDKIAVLGLGTMGHGIAQAFAVGGCQVRVYDESTAVRSSVVCRIKENLLSAARAGFGGEESIERVLSRVKVCTSEAESVETVKFVVEAIKEDMLVKKEIFNRIESLVSPDTILASNTSSFPMTQLSADLKYPQRTVVTHWFNPPHIVPLVEVVPGKKTSLVTIQMTLDLLSQIGKLPVHLKKEIPGFLINRIQIAMLREILDLLDRGVADAKEIDQAVKGSIGLRLAASGPLEVIDFAGLDVTGSTFENLVGEIRSDQQLPTVLKRKIDAGHFGVKAEYGIYQYPPEVVQEQLSRRNRYFLALKQLLDEH